MIENFRKSDAIASLLLVQPTASFDIVEADRRGRSRDICPLTRSDIWINGGFFVMRKEIFRYIQPGEELVREPFQRLIEKQAYWPTSTPASGSAWIPSRTSSAWRN